MAHVERIVEHREKPDRTRVLRELVGPAELIVGLGLVLIGLGLWQFDARIASVAIGAVLLWYALPTRPPFVARRDTKDR